jgi:signal transduction histidine kinase/CheY-like chemotaxis protein
MPARSNQIRLANPADMTQISFIFFFSFICFSLLVFSPELRADVLVLDDKTSKSDSGYYQLGKNLQFLEDPEGKLMLSDVISSKYASRFYKGWQDFPDLKFTRSTYWVRFSILNSSTEKDWYLQSWGSLTRDESVFITTFSGDDLPGVQKIDAMSHSRAPLYHLEIPLGETWNVYMKVSDDNVPLTLALELFSGKSILSKVMNTYPPYSALIGGLMCLVFYNLLLFFHLGEKSFLVLSVFISAIVLEMGFHTGILHYFPAFQKYLPWVGSSFGFLAIVSGLYLYALLINLKHHLPSYYRFCLGLIIMILMLIPFVLFLPYSILWVGMTGLVAIVFILISGYKISKMGIRFPKSLILSFYSIAITSMPAVLRGIEVIPDLGELNDVIYLGLLVATLLLSVTQVELTRRLRDQARQTLAHNKVKDEFLATMSHELRTPMNAVVGVTTLLNTTPLSKLQKSYVEKLDISSRYILDLIDNILDFARLERDSLSIENISFDLDKKILEVKKLLIDQATRKGLYLDFPEHHFNYTLKGDPVRLLQILVNLLGNAIKFTEKGRVSLKIKPQPVKHHKVRLHFRIKDTGIGFSDEQRERIFTAFSQAESSTSRRYGGSGLGLAITKKLVEKMGGVLQVESTPGKGSEFGFSLEFEIASDNSCADSGSDKFQPDINPVSSSVGILLVDDDPINQFIGKELLKVLGFSVDIASDGHEALTLLDKKTYNLVLLDISMPGMDGYETTEKIRQKFSPYELPVVALTAHAVTGKRERCMNAGMNDYLTKPFDLNDLKNIIQKWQ